jgi:hypothetical protein
VSAATVEGAPTPGEPKKPVPEPQPGRPPALRERCRAGPEKEVPVSYQLKTVRLDAAGCGLLVEPQ